MKPSSLKDLAKLVDNLTKIKPPEQQFLDELLQTIERTSVEEPFTTRYRPSGLGGCLRPLYFKRLGIQPTGKRDAGLIRMGESGTDGHARIQNYVKNMASCGYEVDWINVADYINIRKPYGTIVLPETKNEFETRCYNSVLDCNFTPDGLIRLYKHVTLLEIKLETVNKWIIRIEPDPKHIVQASAYCAFLDVDQALFIYEDRDLCRKKTYLLPITPKMKQELVVDKIETCNSYVASGTVPPKSDNTKDCNTCGYKNLCKQY